MKIYSAFLVSAKPLSALCNFPYYCLFQDNSFIQFTILIRNIEDTYKMKGSKQFQPPKIDIILQYWKVVLYWFGKQYYIGILDTAISIPSSKETNKIHWI